MHSKNQNVILKCSIIAASFSFPYPDFRISRFHDSTVADLISTSIRSALDCPLNDARNYLADLLSPCIRRVVYLDSDLILVDYIAKLYIIQLGRDRVLAAPEYCNANFTHRLWSNPSPITESGEGGGV